MITIKFNFNPDDLEKAIFSQLAEHLKKEFKKGGVKDVTVKIDRNKKISLEGPEEEMEKAKSIMEEM